VLMKALYILIMTPYNTGMLLDAIRPGHCSQSAPSSTETTSNLDPGHASNQILHLLSISFTDWNGESKWPARS
jgi:hypothetical protein